MGTRVSVLRRLVLRDAHWSSRPTVQMSSWLSGAAVGHLSQSSDGPGGGPGPSLWSGCFGQCCLLDPVDQYGATVKVEPLLTIDWLYFRSSLAPPASTSA